MTFSENLTSCPIIKKTFIILIAWKSVRRLYGVNVSKVGYFNQIDRPKKFKESSEITRITIFGIPVPGSSHVAHALLTDAIMAKIALFICGYHLCAHVFSHASNVRVYHIQWNNSILLSLLLYDMNTYYYNYYYWCRAQFVEILFQNARGTPLYGDEGGGGEGRWKMMRATTEANGCFSLCRVSRVTIDTHKKIIKNRL